MPRIWVDDEVFRALQSRAIPLVDSPNSVVGRLLGVSGNGVGGDSFGDVTAIGGADSGPSMPKGGGTSKCHAPVPRSPGARRPKRTGKEVAAEYGITGEVNQARHNAPGKWYAHLDRFPAALTDDNGYKIFEEADDYITCPYLQHGEQVNIPDGISSIPGYVRVVG
jgi:hypothetical protein